MNRLTFNEDFCKGCGLCVDACTKKILELAPDKLNKKGYHPARMIEGMQEKCIACTMCAIMCPDCVIKIEKDV